MTDSEADNTLTAERAIELIRLASNPMAKALIALAYYANSADPAVAEATWKP